MTSRIRFLSILGIVALVLSFGWIVPALAASGGGGGAPGPGPSVPSSPTNVVATPGDGQVTITWNPPVSDGGSPVIGYVITSTPETSTIATSDTAVTFTGLTNGVTYVFCVFAMNAAGMGAPECAGPVAPAGPMPVPFVVNSTADPGDGVCDALECTLREAINAATASPSKDTIAFNIPDSDPGYVAAAPGWWRIRPVSPLPTIGDPVVIDGYSQPGASPNPVMVDHPGGLETRLKIELDGTNAGEDFAHGLRISAGDSIVRGLAINRFGFAGIVLVGDGGNQIEGNFIGTDITGKVAAGNGSFGIVINGSPGNIVGGTSAEARNLISGNAYNNVLLISDGNLVLGNLIGPDATGNDALGKSTFGGIEIRGGHENLVGGPARNVISGNGGAGIYLQDHASGNALEGNFIGTDPTGATALGNLGPGVLIERATDNLVEGNVISGNKNHGVLIRQSAGNAVLGNLIGLDATGTTALGNESSGVVIVGLSSFNTVGSAGGPSNVISGNGGDGVALLATGPGNILEGNLIGSDVSGTLRVGNKGVGIQVMDAPETVIGGTNPGSGNVISGNYMGVTVVAGLPVLMQGNLVGTQIDGVSPLGNTWAGILFGANASSGSVIGGTEPGAGNVIAFNGGDGVLALSGIRNAILFNSIHSNAQLGIDLITKVAGDSLEGKGVTENDPGDGDAGANQVQNFPVLTSAAKTLSGIAVNGTLNSVPDASYRLEFFANTTCDPSGYGEGETPIGFAEVVTDAGGNAAFAFTMPADVPAGHFATATATDPDDNTSEFSRCVTVTLAAPGAFLVNSTVDAVDANPGDGKCDDGSGNCTLRAAVMESNALAGPNVIDIPAGTFTLSLKSELVISTVIVLNGAGPSTVIQAATESGVANFRVFNIWGGNATISNMTIRHGRANSPSGGDAASGGGILNSGGILTLRNATVTGNSAAWYGGGIRNSSGITIVTHSTISHNQASSDGGGISSTHGTVAIVNSTITHNSAGGGGGVNINAGLLTVVNGTLVDNSATNGGGMYNNNFMSAANSRLVNTVVARNAAPLGPDCYGAPESLGRNLIGNASGCAFTPAGSDLLDVDAKLGPLADNGGPTQTHSLLSGSPAIDAVPAAECKDPSGNPVTTDQRGMARPQGVACDIGAFELEASKPPAPPTITSVSVSDSPLEGLEVLLNASFSDPDGGGPHSASISWGDGTVSAGIVNQDLKEVTASHIYSDNGVYTVMVKVGDSASPPLTDVKSIAVSVGNMAPAVYPGLDNALNEGKVFTSSGFFKDRGADTWTATVDYGDGSGPQPLALNPDKSFSLAHAYADNGVFTVRVVVLDDDGGKGEGTLVVTVHNVAPSVEAGPDMKAGTGAPVKLAPATFTDPGASDTHTALIDWGDGSPLAAGEVDEAAHSVNGMHIYAASGLFTVKVVVTDKDGDSGSDTFTVLVNAPPAITSVAADQKVPEGVLLSLQVAAFSDPDAGDTHTAGIDWGDGSPSTPGVVDRAAKTVSGSHVYADNGAYTVKVTVSDGGSSASGVFNVVVDNAVPVVEAGVDQSTVEGPALFLKSAGFLDPGTRDTHTATVDWGDGSRPSAAKVIESPFGPPGSTAGMKAVLDAGHVYADNGRYRIQVCVTDDDGAASCDTANVMVSNAPPTMAGGLEFATTEGSAFALGPLPFNDPGSADTHSARVDWGDGTAQTRGDVDQSKDTISAGHVYAENGTYTVTVTVADDDGAAATAVYTVKVANAAPRVRAMVVPTKLAGLPFSAPLALFEDPGTRDTHTAVIDWGDGTTSSGTVSGGTVHGRHRYAKAGTYTVTVTVMDDDGGVGKATLTIAVIDAGRPTSGRGGR
ncbi:MAG: CSLREA domain-containing protein [Chloroflexi bacterium]|nr:CSLREA domain-containing protein [Chloroflexota bacterium]